MKSILWIMMAVVTVSPLQSGESASPAPASSERPRQEFKVAAPVNGLYQPHRDKDDHWYAGEIITLNGRTFRYQTFTDVAGNESPDYTGKMTVFPDHVVLDHPGVPYPYRIAGTLDGRPVLLTWEAHQYWKKTGRPAAGGLLYLQRDAGESPRTERDKRPAVPTGKSDVEQRPKEGR